MEHLSSLCSFQASRATRRVGLLFSWTNDPSMAASQGPSRGTKERDELEDAEEEEEDDKKGLEEEDKEEDSQSLLSTVEEEENKKKERTRRRTREIRRRRTKRIGLEGFAVS
ncbi:uncharacterized protein LOC143150413 [Ptiloglossa arizonensis]|uniref:uncharacterized protein LOC143150413 n=1 Tax=Ptiloglossa arizonensis TaxID=3350558 RepID=UPI003FA0BF1A